MHLFLPGDKVNYVGSKFPELGTKLGVVLTKVGGEPNAVVVDFGDDAFILDVMHLRRPTKDQERFEILRKRSFDYEE